MLGWGRRAYARRGGRASLDAAIYLPSTQKNLIAWYDASRGVTNTGDNTTATAWADLSGSGFNLTNVGAPTYRVGGAGPNGRMPRLVLDGSTMAFTTSSNVIAAGTSRVIIAAVKPTSSTSGGAVCCFKKGTPDCAILYIDAAGTNYCYSDGATVNTPFGPSGGAGPLPTTGAVTIMDWQYVLGSPTQFGLNGVLQTLGTGNATTDTGTTGFYVAQDVAGQFWQGEMYEILIYTGVRTTSQIEKDRVYLAQKWGGSVS
jgi:hypothetical protein